MAIIDAPVWRQNGQKIFAYKYPEVNLSSKTQLNVGMSQEALLFVNGQLTKKYQSGKHTVDTANIPVLRRLFSLPFGGQNPYMAEVWYINKQDLLNISTTTETFLVRDVRYPNGLPLVAELTYGLKVNESEPFLMRLVNEESPLFDTDIEERFCGRFEREVSSKIATVADLGSADLPTLNAQRSRISQELQRQLNDFVAEYGLMFVDFNINRIMMDTSTDAQKMSSGFGYDPTTYQQSRILDIQEKAMQNISNGEGGLLGAIFAMGMMNHAGAQAAPNPSTLYQQPSASPASKPASPYAASTQAAASVTAASVDKTHFVYCSNCGRKYTSDMKFCPHCGDIYWACPRCGADNDTNNKRCVSCGAQLLGEAQQQCPNCGAMIGSDALFCPQCGRPLTKPDVCKQCGAPLNGARFCPQCGTRNGN